MGRGDQRVQHRLHAPPDPDRRDRRAAGGRRVPGAVARGRARARGGVRRPAVARGPAAAVRDAADHRDRDRPPARGHGAALRLRPVRRRGDRPDGRNPVHVPVRGSRPTPSIAVLARAFYARQDTRTPVAAGIISVVVNTIAVGRRSPDRWACRGSAWRSRSAPGWRWRSCSCCSGGACRSCPLGPIFLVGIRSLLATVVASAVAFALRGGLALVGDDRARHRRAARPRRASSAGSGWASTPCWPLPCASRSCPLSSGSWPTCSDARAERESVHHPTRSRRSDGLGRIRLGRRSRLLSPADTVGPGQGRQRLVGGPAGDRRSDRCPGPRPPAAPLAMGIRVRAARPGRERLVAGQPRGVRRYPSQRAAQAGRPGFPRPDRSRSRVRRPARSRRRPPPRAPRRRLPARRADPAERDADHRPPGRRGGALGRLSARSGGSTSTRPERRGSSSSTPTATGSASSTGSIARPPIGRASSSGPRRRIATSGTPSGRTASPGCSSPRRRTASRSRRSSSSEAGRGSSSRTAA